MDFLVFFLAAANAVEFQLVNNEEHPVWVGIQGNPGHTNLNKGGLILNQGQNVTLQAEDDWAGRFWGRTWCNADSNHCGTGNCGNKLECAGAGGDPPVSLAEITLKAQGGNDYYDVSLVDGYNIRIAIEPAGASGDGSQYSCTRSACNVNLLESCPRELQVIIDKRSIIACNSACTAFNTDEYCCRNAYGTPKTCIPSNWGPRDYTSFFKTNCPNAYSYAFDDKRNTFICQANKYIVTFGGV